MKKIVGILALLVVFTACHETETAKSDFTGNESTYPLLSGSTYPINGTVTFKEKIDGTTLIRIELSGTEGDLKHPVHLHLGDLSAPDAAVAALLNPVIGKTGISETLLSKLSDESAITYHELVQYNACIKVHLSDAGPDKNIILAGGNIGIASTADATGGRNGMRVCKSE
jgi:hypothetical protein